MFLLRDSLWGYVWQRLTKPIFTKQKPEESLKKKKEGDSSNVKGKKKKIPDSQHVDRGFTLVCPNLECLVVPHEYAYVTGRRQKCELFFFSAI